MFDRYQFPLDQTPHAPCLTPPIKLNQDTILCIFIYWLFIKLKYIKPLSDDVDIIIKLHIFPSSYPLYRRLFKKLNPLYISFIEA